MDLFGERENKRERLREEVTEVDMGLRQKENFLNCQFCLAIEKFYPLGLTILSPNFYLEP